MENQIIKLKTNANKREQVVWNGQLYWYFRKNISGTIRYICSKKTTNKCGASITLDGDTCKQNGIHDHQRMTESEIKCLIEFQNLKDNVLNNIGLSVHILFTDMEERLVTQNVNPKEIAAIIPCFR